MMGRDAVERETLRLRGVVVSMRLSVRLRVWVLAVCLPAAILSLAGVAQASDAGLDRAFGKGGIRYLPQSLRELGGAALFGDGRILVGNENELRALLPSGKFDPSFGKDGRARLRTSAKGFGRISGFGVDIEDRPVVVGYLEKGIEFESAIERLTPHGRPDSSFAAGRAYLRSHLGVRAADGKASSSYLEDVAFDPDGRLLVMGRAVIGTHREQTKNGPETVSVQEAFVARFESSGRLDPSFGKEGVFRDEGIERLAPGFRVGQSLHLDWSVGPSNKVSLYADHGEEGAILRLGEGGRADPGFGSGGYAEYPTGTYEGPLTDPEEGTVTWGYLEGVPHRVANGILIKRLAPNGASDVGFGRDGSVALRIHRLENDDLTFDEEGRILIVAGLRGRSSLSESKELALLRLDPDGKLDYSFGHHGMLRIRFPDGHREPAAYLEGIEVRDGQALIGASYCADVCRPAIALVDLGSG